MKIKVSDPIVDTTIYNMPLGSYARSLTDDSWYMDVIYRVTKDLAINLSTNVLITPTSARWDNHVRVLGPGAVIKIEL